MLDFVTQRAIASNREWDILLTDYGFWAGLFDIIGGDGDSSAVKSATEDAVYSVLEALVEYHWLIKQPVTTFPCLLRWLVHAPADTPSDNRAQCARDMLMMSNSSQDADRSALTLASLFRPELEEAASTSQLRPRLCEMLMGLQERWPNNTQDIKV